MKPILFEKNETEFATRGIGPLTDAVSCEVSEERNGLFELEMQYPVEGLHYADIIEDNIILAKPNDKDRPQPFRIYRMSKPMQGIVTVFAEHISYQQNFIPVAPFTAESAQAALNGLIQNAVEDCPFTAWTDIISINRYTQTVPQSFRASLGGVRGSILDVYGGEYEFDRWRVNLWKSRGADNGVSILYGKNLIDLKQEKNIQNVITGVYPFWTSGDAYIELPEKVLRLQNAFSFGRTVPLDLSAEFPETPTIEELRGEALLYLQAEGRAEPSVSLTVDFYNLAQGGGYEDIAQLERVGLCDTVNVRFARLGVNVKSKVVAYRYDVLRERYAEIQIGSLRANIARTMYELQKDQITETEVASAVQNATSLITGNRGGYVVLHDADGDKKPDEILIMDHLSIEETLRLWRWNLSGLGYSKTGYNGDYGTAITMDGAIVADFMSTGKLSSKNGRFVIDLDNNTVTMRNASNQTIFSFTEAGGLAITSAITATSGLIGGWSITAGGLSYGSNTHYLGTAGISAAIGGVTRSGIIFKAGGNFGVTANGDAYVNRLHATGGEVGDFGIDFGDLASDGLTLSPSDSEITFGNLASMYSASGYVYLSANNGLVIDAASFEAGSSIPALYVTDNAVEIEPALNLYRVAPGSGDTLVWLSNGNVGYAISSERYKDHIRPLTDADYDYMRLQPVVYSYKEDDEKRPVAGLTAEQTQVACKMATTTKYINGMDVPDGIDDRQILALTVREVQKIWNYLYGGCYGTA